MALLTGEGSSTRCFDCFVESCPMWRRTNDGVILCNVCHLKRTKNVVAVHVKTNLKLKDSSKFTGRKGRLSSRAKQGIVKSVEKAKNGTCRGRRSHMKRKPVKAPCSGTASILTSDSMFYEGLLFQKGDVVSLCDVDGATYFAQLRGFLQDEFCNKSAVITWLIPTSVNCTKFDPAIFTVGPDEDVARPMNCFQFVCRGTKQLLCPLLPQPPFTRTHTNLNHLIAACHELTTTHIESSPPKLVATPPPPGKDVIPTLPTDQGLTEADAQSKTAPVDHGDCCGIISI